MSDAFKIFGNPPDREHEDGEHGETMGRPAVRTPLDLAAARAKLAQAGGRYFWKSLEELAGTPEAEAFEHHEFPYDPEKDARKEGIGRRDILKLMAASAALSGLSACTKLPVEKIVPYVRPPEEIIPGKPLFLRDVDAHGEWRDRTTGGKQHGAADEDRREFGASGEPGCDECHGAGFSPDTLRSRSFAGGGSRRPDQRLGGIS